MELKVLIKFKFLMQDSMWKPISASAHQNLHFWLRLDLERASKKKSIQNLKPEGQPSQTNQETEFYTKPYSEAIKIESKIVFPTHLPNFLFCLLISVPVIVRVATMALSRSAGLPRIWAVTFVLTISAVCATRRNPRISELTKTIVFITVEYAPPFWSL